MRRKMLILALTIGFGSVARESQAQEVFEQRMPERDLDGGVARIAGVLDDGFSMIQTLTQGDLGSRRVLSGFAQNPPAARHEEDPAQRRDDDRRIRRFRARDICNREEGGLIEACFRCAERGDGARWIARGDAASYQRLRELAVVAGHSEGLFRCRDRRLDGVHRLVGELFRRNERDHQGLTAAQTEITQIQQTQGPIEPRLVAQTMAVLVSSLYRDHLEREIAVQERTARVCDAHRAGGAELSAQDRALPEAPASMVAWSEADIRAAGYRPRWTSPLPVGGSCAGIHQHVRALREDLARRLQEGNLPSVSAVSLIAVSYQNVAQRCAGGASPACADAQATLSRMLANRGRLSP